MTSTSPSACVRFAEPCRENHLDLRDKEKDIYTKNVDIPACHECYQDIYLGFFFDGTNNNKFRDSASYGHSNVARLYESYIGTPAQQTQPKFQPAVVNWKCGTPVIQKRVASPDAPFKPDNLSATEFPYYRKVYIAGVGTPFPEVGDTGRDTERALGLGMALYGEARLGWAMQQVYNQIHAAITGMPIKGSIKVDTRTTPPKPDTGKFTEPLTKPDIPPPNTLEKIGGWMSNGIDTAKDIVNGKISIPDEVGAIKSKIAEIIGTTDRELSELEATLKAALEKRKGQKPTLRRIRMTIIGFSRGAAEARAFATRVSKRWPDNKICGLPLSIDFLGVFDTVASVGLAQSAPGANGHMAWAAGDAMVVPSQVKRCVHLVSTHEIRASFPLDSICQSGLLPANAKEIVYPGMHSDVGGGYPTSDQGRSVGNGTVGNCLKLSQIPLAQMYREARMAGVPLGGPEQLTEFHKENFNISPELRADFNAYIEATRTGRVPPTNNKSDPAYRELFPTEEQPLENLEALMHRHYAIFLQWHKKIRGRAHEVGGLKQNYGPTQYQDIEDIRGADAELTKEIDFLESKDPKKFDKVDDLLIDDIRGTLKNVKSHASVASILGGVGALLGLGAGVSSAAALEAIKATMREKQNQWDFGLKAVWNSPKPILEGKAEAAAQKLLEWYVHDSRAWFKAVKVPNTMDISPDAPKEMAPNDEDWFTLGDRDRATAAQTAALKKKLDEQKKAGDTTGASTTQTEIDRLKTQGALIKGGREPYRMYGYVRHRRVYQTGKLTIADWGRQNQIEREESERKKYEEMQEQSKQRQIKDENARHEKAREDILREDRRVMKERPSSYDEYKYGTKQQLANEDRFHAEEMAKIQQGR